MMERKETMDFAIQIFKKEDNTYVATCPKFNIQASGPTVNKAVTRLQQIINFYLTTASEFGVSVEELCFPHQKIKILPHPTSTTLRENIH
jgi:predicted RNase H-like HicB family nuclease